MGYLVSSILAVSPNDRHSYFLYFIPSDDMTFGDEYQWIDKWAEKNFSRIARLVGPTGVIIEPTSNREYYLGGVNFSKFCLFEEANQSPDKDVERLHSGFPYFVFSKSPLQRVNEDGYAVTINLARFGNEQELNSLLETLINTIRTDEWQELNELPKKFHISPNIFIAGRSFTDTLNGFAKRIIQHPSDKSTSILFLAADPSDASRLRLGEEFREIDEQLTLAKQRGRFSLALPQLSLRSKDITRALLNTQPQIVHFSGHGTPQGALCFENEIGKRHDVQPDALAALFEQFADQVNCVVLNACYSDVQAKAIAEHINYVIGMNKALGDKAAIAFALGFYGALGAGRTIEDAYKLGCVQIRLEGIPEHLTPVLIKKGQASSQTAA